MKKIKFLNIFATSFLLPVVALADNIVIAIPNPAGSNTNLMDIVNSIVSNVILPIGAVVVVLYIIYAGFTFVTAQGAPKEIEAAKGRLLWALIGGAILLGSVAISAAVRATINQIISS